jgi:DNA-binding CsgD family transcriptional regulator
VTHEGNILDLAGRIYECASDARAWPDTLRRIAELARADGALVGLVEPATEEIKAAACWNLAGGAGSALLLGASTTPALTSGSVAPCEPVSAANCLGREEFRSSAFYRAALVPFGYGDAIVAVLARSPSRFGALILPRKAPAPAVREQLEPVRQLAPHLRRAVTTADMFDAVARWEGTLSATMDLLTVGVVLVDGGARIVHANRAARAHLDDAQAVRRSGDRLSARNPAAAAALKDAVAAAARAGVPDRTGIAVPVPGCDGCDLAAWVLPLGAPHAELGAAFPAKAAVFLRRIGDTQLLPGELFARRYGITPAETRVLAMLAKGLNPHEAADALGCSEPTVRTHLQRLFLKTGTRGQPDLMRLAASAVAPAALIPGHGAGVAAGGR